MIDTLLTKGHYKRRSNIFSSSLHIFCFSSCCAFMFPERQNMKSLIDTLADISIWLYSFNSTAMEKKPNVRWWMDLIAQEMKKKEEFCVCVYGLLCKNNETIQVREAVKGKLCRFSASLVLSQCSTCKWTVLNSSHLPGKRPPNEDIWSY